MSREIGLQATSSADLATDLTKHFKTPEFKISPDILSKACKTHVKNIETAMPAELKWSF